jgi:para-aminobenzoate synthetase/4-amino-4-deoxychorismate lyase
VNRLDVVLRTPWGGPWRGFREPTAVLTAERVGDVRECLREVDRAVRRSGFYAAGFVAYEAAGAFGLPVHGGTPGSLPLVCFGLYTADRVTSQGRPRPRGVSGHEALTHRADSRGGSALYGLTGPGWIPSIDHAAYLQAIDAIKARIAAGDTYQINFTFRLRAPWTGDPLALLGDLHAAQRGAWGAYVDTGRHAIASASPELFFAVNGGRIECRPMKGTAPRGLWPSADLAQAEALRMSAKNRAENVMIVDMVRNDLGRIARTGSVEVASLFDIERYPRHWQMTSHVVADAEPGGLLVIFDALFPSGSVTGAPKHSSMGIIRELEASPRGIYTGAIGYLSPNGRGHFNVAIRTVAIDREAGTAEFGVGSGIVWDSVDRDEYDECLLKASILAQPPPPFRLLETIAYAPQGSFRLLDRHLERLRASADYFGFVFDEREAREMLGRAVADLRGASKLRLLLSRDGSLVCEATDLEPGASRPLIAELAVEPIDPSDVFLYHKTTERAVYTDARAARPRAEAVLLWNPAGEVTEGTDANIVVELDGRRVTPPVECGLLAGTMRAELIATGEIVEQRVTIDDLHRATRAWLINSVRGWMEIECRLQPH